MSWFAPLCCVLNGKWLYREINPWFAILTIIRNNRFRFEIEDLADLPGLNSMIYADDEEAGGDRIGAEGTFQQLIVGDTALVDDDANVWSLDGDASVGGVHRKYGLEDGGIVVCRPDGYGK